MFCKILILFLSVIISSECKEEYIKKDTKSITIEGLGKVTGTRYWEGGFHEFYGVPYAIAPRGADKFKAPLPPSPWIKTMKANRGLNMCEQVFMASDPENDKKELYGEPDCLSSHMMVPEKGTKENPVPVIVVVHGGGFAGGSSTMAKLQNVVKHDVLVMAINYRVGAIGFACLGTEDIPGNAALKDIIAALEWVQKYIKNFGGDPTRVTLYGYSVGATLAELVALSPRSKGLFHKLILDSGSALAPFAIDRDPIGTAKNVAISLGFNPKEGLEDLNDFLREVNVTHLQAESRNFFLKNSSFGFTPCIEKPSKFAVITESPLDIFKKDKFEHVPLLIGFSDLEGISRTSQFETWGKEMDEDLYPFLPVDLIFSKQSDKDYILKTVRQKYFGDKKVSENVKTYIDYFSDIMFKYPIMRSVTHHAQKSAKFIFLYEFTYFGAFNTEHAYMDKVQGASHRDQTGYVLDFYKYTRNYTDMDFRENMITMWVDFAKFENPTAYESSFFTAKWPKFKIDEPLYMELGYEFTVKHSLFAQAYGFWDEIYSYFYWNPTAPEPEDYKVPKHPHLRKAYYKQLEKEKNKPAQKKTAVPKVEGQKPAEKVADTPNANEEVKKVPENKPVSATEKKEEVSKVIEKKEAPKAAEKKEETNATPPKEQSPPAKKHAPKQPEVTKTESKENIESGKGK